MSKYIFVNRFFYPDHSATSQILSDLVFDLSKSDVDIHVVTSRYSYDNSFTVLPAKENIGNVFIHRVWTSNFGRMNLVGRAIDYLSFYLSAIVTLIQLVRRNDVLITKTDPPLMSTFSTLIAKFFRAKSINWVQDLFPEVAINLDVKILRGRFGKLLIHLRNYSLNGASTNVVIGEKMREHLIGEGINSKNINIIQNWADGNKIRPVSHNPLKTEWGLDGKFVIGYSGNLGRAHDSETIINAMIALKNNEKIVFLFIGGGSHTPKVQQACQDYNITNVVFKSYQPRELLQLSLSVADVHWLALQPQLEGLIVPSKFYGIAAAGKPVVFLGDRGGELGKLICRHYMGFAIPLGDYETLVEKFNLLALNSQLCELMGINSREVFDGKFNKHLALNAWKKVLSSVAETQSAVDVTPIYKEVN
jgi:glycosyltransferase involved in cell wall biosynthesis